MKINKIMLSIMLAATTIFSQYVGAEEPVKDNYPTLSYQVISDEYNIAVSVFAFMQKPMYISYRNTVDCAYKDEAPVYEDGDLYTSGLKQIDLSENSEYQMTVYPIKQVGESIETLMIFMIPEKSKNELYKIDENCSLELGEKVFKKYTIIQKFKPNEMTPVKVGNNYVEVKLIELETPKEIL
jgi:hypothetical protein